MTTVSHNLNVFLVRKMLELGPVSDIIILNADCVTGDINT